MDELFCFCILSSNATTSVFPTNLFQNKDMLKFIESYLHMETRSLVFCREREGSIRTQLRTCLIMKVYTNFNCIGTFQNEQRSQRFNKQQQQCVVCERKNMIKKTKILIQWFISLFGE